MNEVKYIVCYTENNDDNTTTTEYTERFDNFLNAVERYTLFCGAKTSVVLADVVNNQILKQFSCVGGKSTIG